MGDKLVSTVPLSSCQPKIMNGLMAVGVDSVFWMQINGKFVDLMVNSDAASIDEVRAHEAKLRNDCEYDRANLYQSRLYLANSVDQDLQRKINVSIKMTDGGPVFWCLAKRNLHGAETSKLIRHQEVIRNSKLTDVPGYDVSKFHEVILPALTACH